MKRVLTALVLAPSVAYLVLWAPFWAFAAVLAAVAVLCFIEYSGIVAEYGIAKPGPLGFAGGLLFLLLPRQDAGIIVITALLALVLAMRSTELAKVLPYAGALVLGIVYIFGGWRAGMELRELSPYWLFFALVLNWVGDSAAFYGGRAFGRRRLAPRVSPGKSWEGAAASLAGSLIFGGFFLTWAFPEISPFRALALTAAGNIAGQFGDLAESALKRGAGVKDSGTLLPGHGGWLDRVDSSLFSVPVVYYLLASGL